MLSELVRPNIDPQIKLTTPVFWGLAPLSHVMPLALNTERTDVGTPDWQTNYAANRSFLPSIQMELICQATDLVDPYDKRL